MYGHVLCILSYEGSALDIEINYTVLILNLCVAAVPFFRSYCTHDTSVTTSSARTSLDPGGVWAILSLVFVIGFQIVLCVLVHCTGISIIWCAVGGWILMDWKYGHNDLSLTRQQANVLIIDLFVIIYYFIVAEIITTLAHM